MSRIPTKQYTIRPFVLNLPCSVYCTHVWLSQRSVPCDCLGTRDQILKSNGTDHTTAKFSDIMYLAVSEDQVLLEIAHVKNLKAKRSRILKHGTETRQAWLHKQSDVYEVGSKLIQSIDLKAQIYLRKITCYMLLFCFLNKWKHLQDKI